MKTSILLLRLIAALFFFALSLFPEGTLDAAEAAAGSPAQPAAFLPLPEELVRLVPADATMIGTADLPAVFATTLFNSLWGHSVAQPVNRLAARVQEETGCDFRRDLRQLLFFASSDHLSTASFVLTGRFNRERFDAYLRGKRGAQPIAGMEYAYALTMRNKAFFLAFPTPNLAVLTFHQPRLVRHLQVILGQAPAALAADLSAWGGLPPSGSPAGICFKDLGMFVGGQQPFALVGRSDLSASESGRAVTAVFHAELPDAAAADQFAQLLNALRQLASGYFRNQPSPVTTSILEAVRIDHAGRIVTAQSTESVERLLVLPDENKP